MFKKFFLFFPIKIVLVSLFLPFSNIVLAVNKSESLSNNDNLSIDYLQKKNISEYILGAGDAITITVYPAYRAKEYLIDGEGTISINSLGRIYIEGLTINELKKLLTKKYEAIIKEPFVSIEIYGYRPISGYLDGEINNPGMISLPASQLKINDENPSYFIPTLFNVIRKSGGITRKTNLSDIEVIRKNTQSNGGGLIKTNLDFTKFLELNDTSVNIRIYDGDIIKFKKSDGNNLGKLSKAILSNLNPLKLSVFVAGRVNEPGTKLLSKFSSLNDAIYIAGGTKTFKGKIRFTRLNPDGSMDKRSIKFKPNSNPGAYNNPFLRSGDIIYVTQGPLGYTTEILKDLSAPFLSIFVFTEIF